MEKVTIRQLLGLDSKKDLLNAIIENGIADDDSHVVCLTIDSTGCVRLFHDVSEIEVVGILEVTKKFVCSKLIDAGED